MKQKKHFLKLKLSGNTSMRLKTEEIQEAPSAMGTTRHGSMTNSEKPSLKVSLPMNEYPIAPRDSKEWFPQDEIFFIKSMVMPYRDYHDRHKLYPSVAEQYKLNPVSLLKGYLEGLDGRKNWGSKIEPIHVSKFRTIATALLISLQERRKHEFSLPN